MPSEPSQHEIVDAFIRVEFLHSLGSYSSARRAAESISDDSVVDAGGALRRTLELNSLLEERRDDPCPESEDGDPHQPVSRHPNPIDSPKRRAIVDDERPANRHEQALLLDDDAQNRLQRITNFYGTGIAAFNQLLQPNVERSPSDDAKALERLGACLFWDRDPTSSTNGINDRFRREREEIAMLRERGGKADEFTRSKIVTSRLEAKRQRLIERRQAVEDALKPRLTHQREWEARYAGRTAQDLATTCLTRHRDNVLTAGFVLQCLVAAHLRLHWIEHFLAKPFREAMEMNSVERELPLQRLREAEALNTFVYAACRNVPWIFARNKKEMKAVFECCEGGFNATESESDGDVPRQSHWDIFGALWRSQRVAFIAMHRRAYGHSLRDALSDESYNDTAFKDYHKLQRLLRVQRRIVLNAEARRADEAELAKGQFDDDFPPRVLIAALGASAETHIGDLYRKDHAHHVALNHYCDAHDRLENLLIRLREEEEEEGKGSERQDRSPVVEALWNSRWRIHLMMSKGKGFYEAGNLKRSVMWFLKSWHALLELLEGDADRELGPAGNEATFGPEANEIFDELQNAIDTLQEIKNDPDFSKGELARELCLVVERMERIDIPSRVGVIASEILLRLGHALYVLRLGSIGRNDGASEKHALASRCLRRAADLDPHSTLVRANLLKIESEDEEFEPVRTGEGLEEHQWPFGRSNPEQLIRMIEYHLLMWVTETRKAGKASDTGLSPKEQALVAENQDVARNLLTGLLTHTDSINVRQSQVYRYLMQPKRPPRGMGPAESWDRPNGSAERREPAIEFVCLRRYSSFFPFVPRPSAFRSVGGGYLLRLHHHDESCPQPYGIAIDPGPDFIENLYRCGFGLGDINMIVLTHDHPDHTVDLDPILSLLGYRMQQGDRTFVPPRRSRSDGDPVRRLLIVGNESVARQLSFFNKPHRSWPQAAKTENQRPDAIQVVSFDELDAFLEELRQVRETLREPEVAVPRELRIKPVVSIRHVDGYGMLAYGFRVSLGDEGPSIGFTGDTGGFELDRPNSEDPWRIVPKDKNKTMQLTGDSNWREHWADLLDSDVLIPHVSGLPLSQLLVLANEGRSSFGGEKPLAELLSKVWNGLDDDARKQVGFAFWLPEEEHGITPLPLDDIKSSKGWPGGHLYLIGLLEFARAYKEKRQGAAKPGLLLVGELREELGSLRGKIAYSLNTQIFGSNVLKRDGEESDAGCRALTADVGLRLMISKGDDRAQVRVLCSICDLDNDRTRDERFHDPSDIRDVSVKGENEGIFYTCSNHDPLRYTHEVFIERIERYDVFADPPIR